MNIVEFLEARIAEDEAAAKAAIGTAAFSQQTGYWTVDDAHDEYGRIPLVFAVAKSGARTQVANFSEAWEADERRAHIARHNPARVLAECAAKRAIIELARQAIEDEKEFDDYEWQGTVERAEPWTGDAILHALAAVYKEHADYREEWRHA